MNNLEYFKVWLKADAKCALLGVKIGLKNQLLIDKQLYVNVPESNLHVKA